MFSLTAEQGEKLDKWLEEQALKICPDGSPPYMGACGGGVTYEFTPTSLGLCTSVTWMKGTKHEASINLTNYDEW